MSRSSGSRYPRALDPSLQPLQRQSPSGSVADMTNRGGGGGALDGQLHMESQNDDQLGLLHSKVGALKSLTLQIENEVADQNRFLSGMTHDFDRTRGAMQGTMKRLNKMMATQSGRYTCYMIFFVLFVFLVVYWLIRRGG